MNIIIIDGSFIDFNIQLANQIRKKANVLLILPKNKQKEYEDTINDKITVFWLGASEKRWYNLKNLSSFINMLTTIKSFKPDLIHLIAGAGILALFVLPFIKNYILINTIWDPEPHIGLKNSFFIKFVLKLEVKWSNQLITTGEKLRDVLIEKYKLCPEKVDVVPVGEYDVAPFTQYSNKNIKEKGNLILFFGSIWEYKGLKYLIKAEPLISKVLPGIKIIIAGKGEDFKKYRDLMKNEENFIVYNDFISFKHGAELFQKSSVVVLPYIDATQSGVIPVAYGFKKPVVVTDVGSLPEIVDNGKTGFIVKPKDPEELSKAIISILENKNLKREMGDNAYKKLKNELSWEIVGEKSICVYKKTIQKIDDCRKSEID